MSEHEKDGLTACLFSRQDMKLRNIKFFRGEADVISAEDFRRQSCSTIEQQKTGQATRNSGPTRSDVAPLDVRAYVANM